MNTPRVKPLRIVVCWSGISGYMSACWRELSRREGVELHVLAWDPRTSSDVTAFDDGLMAGISHRLLNQEGRFNGALIRSLVVERKPDVVMLVGWSQPALIQLSLDKSLGGVRFFMGMDTPYRGTLRQRLGRFKMGRFLDRMARVFVTGERSYRLARVLGIEEQRIARGVYGIDYAMFEPCLEKRREEARGWPGQFLFSGRYVEEKGIDVLVEGYRRYRQGVTEAWGLSCCGKGPLGGLLKDQAGISDLGFVQPGEQPALMARSGVFVLPSRFDPWPLAVVEACAAGLPVICSEACGSGVELIRPFFNGLTVATGDAGALARAMRWMHEHVELLGDFGRRSQGFAAAYRAEIWADRFLAAVDDTGND